MFDDHGTDLDETSFFSKVVIAIFAGALALIGLTGL
jgi:hypothetical protein